MAGPDVFAPAEGIADAVLDEGYVLYPYRASADKNRMRWQWGVVGPRGAAADGVGEDDVVRAELPVRHRGGAAVRLRVRGLQLVRRAVERIGATPEQVEVIRIGDRTHVSFDEGDVSAVDVGIELDGTSSSTARLFHLPADRTTEHLGRVGGDEFQLVRERRAVTARITVQVEPRVRGVDVVRVEVRNTTSWEGGDRDEANRRSIVGTHVLAAVDGGEFLSTTDPPDGYAHVVQACVGHRLWPSIVDADRAGALVLASPVILPDRPAIAPESLGSFHDGLEIDELLSLRVLAITDDEKTEARATDPRAAAIIDRVDSMGPDEFASLHGTIRSPDGTVSEDDRPWWDQGVDGAFDPHRDGIVVDGVAITRDSPVRLRPCRRADAHDIFYRDREATVAAIVHDVDGRVHVAVTVDDDPAADLLGSVGRYVYFAPDEVQPLRGRRR